MNWLMDLMRSPEAQSDAHYWASVLLAHAALGAAVTLALAATRLSLGLAAIWTSVIYLVGVEGGQVALALYDGRPVDLLDGAVDATAVALGAALVWATWHHRRRAAAVAGAVLAAILTAGVSRRR
ncbi:hypothetical protein ACEYYA_02640 [Paracoccus sp. p3-h83]|uniref:hypothetical protein n=1 Tax=Paracoccus sp. p3-h83 TaxID=3342805 RepID=UPI0035B92979